MNENKLSLIVSGQINAAQLTAEELRDCIELFNTAYRTGSPIVSDIRYDHEFKVALAELSPDDELLTRVEPEPDNAFGDLPVVRHKTPMLSTDNAFNGEAIQKFIDRVQAVAAELGIEKVQFKATGKLDGWSGNDAGGVIATRGQDGKGTNVTHILERGVVIVGGKRDQGAGEIIIDSDYFNKYLADKFTCGRNFLSSVVGAEEPNPYALKALSDGVCHFVPYCTLPVWTGNGDAFMADFEAICDSIDTELDYDMDGVVLECINPDVKQAMGANSHHHKWMVAVKLKHESSVQTVTSIDWTTSRGGTVTPTAIYDTVFLSGGNLSRALAHHAQRVLDWGIGVGAEVEIVRSGSVIPKIVRVIKKANVVTLPEHCPSCGHSLEMQGLKLHCPNGTACNAQVERGLLHFFKVMGNIDEYGPKTIEKIVENGITTLPAIFDMKHADFTAIGFGDGEANQLVTQLARCQEEAVEDWRFLAAFGLVIGRGDSRKLLEVFPLEVIYTLFVEQVSSIHGFGDVIAPMLVKQLDEKWDLIQTMMDKGFNLERTLIQDSGDSPIDGLSLVFTGAMQHGSRDDMTKQARLLGANPQSKPSKSTSYLVCGKNVGQAKLDLMDKLNAAGASIKRIDEDAYLALIGTNDTSTDIEIFNTSLAA